MADRNSTMDPADPSYEPRLLGLTAQKLSLAADYYGVLCPAVSRSYMSILQAMKEKLTSTQTPVSSDTCRFCGSIYRADNFSVRSLATGSRLDRRIERVVAKATRRGLKTLGRKQTMLYKGFMDSGTRLAVTCQCCMKRTVRRCTDANYRGQKRARRAVKAKEEQMSTKSQKKKEVKKKKKKKKNLILLTEAEKAGLTLPESAKSTSSPALQKPTQQNSAKPNAAQQKPVVLAKTLLKEITRGQSAPTQQQTLGKVVGKKKKMTALAKMMLQEKKSQKSSGGSLASFLSSL